MDVVVTKWAAIEGTVILAEEKKEELLERYPAHMIREAEGFKEYLSVEKETVIARRMEAHAVYDAGSGGIFGVLWKISCEMAVGLDIDLKKIPIRQETIELCEFFDLNPYQLLSGGMLVILTDQGKSLVEELSAAGISAQIIGNTNSGNDKIIRNGEKIRYLDPVRQDEIYRLFPEKSERLINTAENKKKEWM